MNFPSPLQTRLLTGAAITPYLQDLARLRIAVFREWPYLYDGDIDHEQAYLARLSRSPKAGLVLASDGDMPVGCATALPMVDAGEAVAAPFRAAGIDPGGIFYFGESVLLPAYRGRGTGAAFFAGREAHARAVSECGLAVFCGVIRPAEHPLRPAEATTPEHLWRRMGYAPIPGMVCVMRWKQVDGPDEVENRLAFWSRSLRE